jgi:hypothetical protein
VQQHHRFADSGSYCGTRDNCEDDLKDKRHFKRQKLGHILSMIRPGLVLIFSAKNLTITAIAA